MAITLGGSWLWGGAATALQEGDPSRGKSGIDAYRLQAPPYQLTGRKIAIGQVEIGRPAKFGLDKAAGNNQAVRLIRAFFRDTPAKTNTGIDPHAQNVASIMISTDKWARGIAPEARLYSAAVGNLRRNAQPEECLSAQHVALQNGGDVRAINFSFGESLAQDPRPNAQLDGNALLTQCVDWSARIHNVVYVIAGNQGKGGIPIPTDNYNGITVAFTTQAEGLFAQIDFANLGSETSDIAKRVAGIESNVGPRRAIGLVAPGSGISVLNPDGKLIRSSGTSFAAPHVTATVALLQELGDRQLQKRANNWSLASRRQEVMRAVLLNSADKIRDQGDGLRLGMTRTLLARNRRTWLESDAYRDRAIPLDAELGAGQLNAFRAYQQLSGGQWSPERPVPAIGWDYRQVAAPESVARASASPFQDYLLTDALKGGSFLAATLVWNRRVELNDANRNGQYDIGESFVDQGLNNLDLYLMRAEDTDTAQSLWSSNSIVDSTEHLFFQIPATGRYKLRVLYRGQVNEAIQPYALAWWAVPQR
ncbi:S8 family serine peptidase [Trichothermofontia sp.]